MVWRGHPFSIEDRKHVEALLKLRSYNTRPRFTPLFTQIRLSYF